MREKPRVGEILVQAGIIDELQLAAALGEQARWGRRLGMTLVKLGMVQEGQLVRALAKQFDLPVASLTGKKIAPEVLALVPAKTALEHSVIPLFVKQEGRKAQLFLGMEEPSDLIVLDELAFRTGMQIRPVMVAPSELGEAIDRFYASDAASPARPTALEPWPSADTLGESNLRSLHEVAPATPIEASLPAPPPIPQPVVSTIAEPIAEAAAPPIVEPIPQPFARVDLVSVRPSAPSTRLDTAPIASPPPPLPSPASPAVVEALSRELARAIEETERTRLVAKAIAHLLIDKGVLTLDELQARIEKTKVTRPDAAPPSRTS